MEQLNFDLNSTEERELVLPPTKAQRMLAVLKPAIARLGLDIRVTHINVKYSTMDDISFSGFYEGMCQYLSYAKGATPPGTRPRGRGRGSACIFPMAIRTTSGVATAIWFTSRR